MAPWFQCSANSFGNGRVSDWRCSCCCAIRRHACSGTIIVMPGISRKSSNNSFEQSRVASSVGQGGVNDLDNSSCVCAFARCSTSLLMTETARDI
jgi:hypothetical protein